MKILQTITNIWNTREIRNQILFTLACIVIYRLLAHIPVPGADTASMAQVLQQNQILGAFSLLTGGGIKNFSIILMGLSPYINASIIMQLMTVVSPRLEALSKEGEHGQRIINKYTRYITIPLAFLQSYGMIILINSLAQVSIMPDTSFPHILMPMLIITTGTLFLMWIGEIMSEKGISNGISILIFAGIIANIPQVIGQQFGLAQFQTDKLETLLPFLIVFLVTLLLTLIVVGFTEAQRNIPITYSAYHQRAASNLSMIPIRVNQAGMIPIIFAVSLMTFPIIVARFFVAAKTKWLADIANWVVTRGSNTGYLYILVFFLLCIIFSFFYVSITFNPEQVAENIQKRGGFIVGLRPGKQTAQYLEQVSNRITLFGGLFIGFIAVFPLLLGRVFNFFTISTQVPLLIGGAGLLITVGVVLEITRKINTALVMQDYDRLR